MPTPAACSPPHHRFDICGQHAGLHFQVKATLAAPWTTLFGPSGSGKSTLLRALAGLVPALTTRFDRFLSSPAAWHSLSEMPVQARDLAYDPQQALLLPHLSVADNIRFPEQLRSLPAARSRLPELTALLQLGPLLHRQPGQLSGGERQRVALARALAVPGARLLLLDEPFAGLDRALRDALLAPLRDHLVARNLPVLSVTHDPDEALLLGADVLRLHRGQLVAQGPVRNVLQDEILRMRSVFNAAP